MRQPLVYEGEYGFKFRMTSGFDASGLISAAIEFKAPDGTKTSQTATAVTTDAAGDFEWTATEDFFTKGKWMAQLVLTFGGKVIKSDPRRFTVGPAISAT